VKATLKEEGSYGTQSELVKGVVGGPKGGQESDNTVRDRKDYQDLQHEKSWSRKSGVLLIHVTNGKSERSRDTTASGKVT